VKTCRKVLNLIVCHLMRKKIYFVWCVAKNTPQMTKGSG
jgi:hypothetical protein